MSVRFVINFLFMMYNEVTYLKIKTMLLEIQTFNAEKKHCEVHNTKNKAENEKQINSSL